MHYDPDYQEAILQYLPHREPFLFADSVELVEGRIVAARVFKAEEPYFVGHFPGYPVVPGILLLESLFQCGGIGVRKMGIEEAGTFFLAKVEGVRYRRQVLPGEEYRMEIENIKATPSIVHQRGRGYVGEELAVEATWISLAVKGKDYSVR